MNYIETIPHMLHIETKTVSTYAKYTIPNKENFVGTEHCCSINMDPDCSASPKTAKIGNILILGYEFTTISVCNHACDRRPRPLDQAVTDEFNIPSADPKLLFLQCSYNIRSVVLAPFFHSDYLF